MADTNCRVPPPLNLEGEQVAETYKSWKRQVEIFLIASRAAEKPQATQTAIILNCAGPQAINVYDQFIFAEGEDKNNPQTVLTKLEQYCTPIKNEVLQSHRFWMIPYREPFDSFLTELRSRAESCNFQESDRMIRDKIVFSVKGKLQEQLLREKDLNLQKTLDICRAYEQSAKQAKEMSQVSQDQGKLEIDKVSKYPRGQKKQRPPPQANRQRQNQPRGDGDRHRKHASKQPPNIIDNCKYCGGSHEKIRSKCPAWDEECRKCHGRNHYAKVCRNSVNAVQGKLEEEQTWLAAIGHGKDRVSASMEVNSRPVSFQIDTAADVNTLCQRYVKKEQVSQVHSELTMWNNAKFKPLGEATLEVLNPKTQKIHVVKFTVVPNKFTCLLGLKTITEMDLVSINVDKFIAQIKSNETGNFGNLGETKLYTDPDVTPRALPSRRIPIALQEEVKKELDNLTARGILIPVTEPTAWVSQMAVVKKSSGKLRICIDPQPLNVALQREHYKLSTLDDILPHLANAKVFSKFDVKEAFWHIKLDEESSKLTTMITPFGRYRWSRLPFGLKVSSEIFARRLQEALVDLKGVLCIADDITVCGYGDTMEEAVIDHDQNVIKLLERCKQKNIKLNEEKAVHRSTSIPFMGHLLSKDGVSADPKKIEAICKMPPPTDIHGVNRLCGTIQYLSSFLPSLADDLEPINELKRKDVPFVWSKECEVAFSHIKEKVTKVPVLAYFDTNKEVTLQVDSSKDGLGAVLLQNGRPVEYASRALNATERRWAQIEKEALALVFGLERFDQYTYGRKVIIENDHKPLASILAKPLSQSPKRLQALRLRLYRYDVEFKWIEGKNLILADALSRAFIENMPESARVLNVNALYGIPDKRIQEIQDAMTEDPTMNTLLETIIDGWPEHKSDLPQDIQMYFDVRDTLSHQDGIILKGERMLIPPALRHSIKNKLHAAHLGADTMTRRARTSVFWPGMMREIKQLADSCSVCQLLRPENQKETLEQHSRGKGPWDKVGTDIFQLYSRNNMVTVDYFSNFIEVDYLSTTTTTQVINKLKGNFARYGIPRLLFSDNGPQYGSKEFQEFTNDWGIIHTTSSPHYPKSNGKAEAAVKIVKTMMTKAIKSGSDQYSALLELRNTPCQLSNKSPAHIMFGRLTRSMIPRHKQWKSQKRLPTGIQRRSQAVKKSYDKNAKDLPKLPSGQSVFFSHQPGDEWRKGYIKGQIDSRSYHVQGEGGEYRRNRVHIRPDTSHSATSHTTEQEAPRIVAETPPAVNIEQPKTGTPVKSHHTPQSAEQTVDSRPHRTPRQPAWLKDYTQ